MIGCPDTIRIDTGCTCLMLLALILSADFQLQVFGSNRIKPAVDQQCLHVSPKPGILNDSPVVVGISNQPAVPERYPFL